MKYSNPLGNQENNYCWVYGNLLKNVQRVDFCRLIELLEELTEDAVYSFSIMGHRGQYLWLLVRSQCRDYRSRQNMACRIHQSIDLNHLTGKWAVFLKQLPYHHLN